MKRSTNKINDCLLGYTKFFLMFYTLITMHIFFGGILTLFPIIVKPRMSSAQEVPEIIMIEHNIHRLDRFGPVRFTHLAHIELGLECKKCHHDWDEKSYDLPLDCVKCHGRDTVGNVVSLRSAFLKQCLGCHMMLGPDGNKTGPTVCTDCHLYKKF